MSVNTRGRRRRQQAPTRVFKKTTAATDRLREEVRAGAFQPGRYINKKAVSQEYGIGTLAMETVCQALAKEGVLEARNWQSRTTYYVPKPSEPAPQPVPAGLLAEARASVALDGETQTYGEEETARRTWGIPRKIANAMRRELAEGKHPVGTVLPTQVEMAGAYGVHHLTMYRAMAILKDEGWIESKPGRQARVIALPPLRDEPVEELPTTKHTTVRQYVLDKIEDGTYAPGSPLPSVQMVANANHAGYQTVLYVYERLHNQGILAKDPDGNWIVSQGSEQLPSDPPPAEPPAEPSSEAPNPFANLIGFVTRLADIGATAELERLWELESTGLSREVETKLQAEIAELRKELDDIQGENRNLVSGIAALREEKVIGVGRFKNLTESYHRLQEAHERILAEYEQIRRVAKLIGSPQPNGGVSKLAVETALRERKPLPARPGY